MKENIPTKEAVLKQKFVWGIGVLLIIAAIIAVKEFHFEEKFQQVIAEQAEANGINGLSVGDISVGLFAADIKNVKLATLDKWGGEIKVGKIILHYNPLSLITKRSLRKITIDDGKFKINTSKSLDKQISALNKLLPQGDGKSAPVMINLVELKDIKLEMEHGDFEVKLPLDGQVTLNRDGFELDLKSEYDDDLQGKLTISGQRQDGKLQLAVSSPKFKYDEDGIETELTELEINIVDDNNSSPAVVMSCTLNRLKYDRYGQLARPITIRGKAIMAEGVAPVELQLQSSPENVLLTAKGGISLQGGKHTMKIDMPRRKISDIWTATAAIEELLGKQVQQFDGKLWITGDVSYDKHVQSDLNIWLTECDLVLEDTKLSNIVAKLQVSTPWPLRFVNDPVVTIDEVKTDALTMYKTKVYPRFSKDEVRIIKIETNTLGGRAILTKLEPVEVGKHKGYAFALQVRGIDMGQLFQIAQVNGLSGNAKLDGSAAAKIYGKIFDIEHAKLKSVSDLGLLQYNPSGESVDKSVQAPENLTMEVLKNLNFTRLNVSLKRKEETGRKLQAKIKITGYNKDVLNGHPFEFNIATTGELDKLIKTSLMDLSRPQDIETIKELIENHNPRRSE